MKQLTFCCLHERNLLLLVFFTYTRVMIESYWHIEIAVFWCCMNRDIALKGQAMKRQEGDVFVPGKNIAW